MLCTLFPASSKNKKDMKSRVGALVHRYPLSAFPSGYWIRNIRSVGPAGGPIHRLVWNDHRLTVNDLWKLDGSNVSLLALGHEGDSGWTRARNAQARWQGDDGWGYALLGLRSPTRNILRINLSHAESHSELEASSATATFVAQLPDPRFMQSLNSQVVNLMMGLVDDQTRPGDPTNYPLAWLRDGAYVVVGLARAGQLEIAKKLAIYFAKHDFFGGFGPEADAPGLSLWVIETVANLAKDPNFDRAVWPDVERKASFIIAMRHAVHPIHQDPFGPIVPAYVHDKDLSLVCDPSKDGLIMGRMDWERPVLFINAVSYQGLEAAADFAQRLGAGNQEKQWRKEAAEAQLTWRDALANPRYEDDRTYISTLWPTWAGSGVEAEYKSLLTTHWDKSHNADGQYKSVPLWTYFDIADAHQWLYLGEPARTWKTLDWFWEHQSSVGLYTWWEGNGEENSFGRWRNIRGWVNPPNVTPHYWTASEMLLLQIDILGYADSSGKEPVIVVGAGIPRDWIKSDMSVRGVSTELGLVDWRWSHKELTVTVHGSHAKVRAGTSFGDSAKVLVRYVELGT
jgi:hypothetical protein